MQVSANYSSHVYQRALGIGRSTSASASSYAASAGAEDVAPQSPETDQNASYSFSNMTRQELRDWVNEQLQSGGMTIEDSMPFVAMSLPVSSADVGTDAASDATRYDFLGCVRQGLDAAYASGDEGGAQTLQQTLGRMMNAQTPGSGLDLMA